MELVLFILVVIVAVKTITIIMNVLPNAEIKCPKCGRQTFRNQISHSTADVWRCTVCGHQETYIK